MLSGEKTAATAAMAQPMDGVEVSIMSTEPEVVKTSVLVLSGPGFGNFVIPPRENAATLLIGDFSVSRSCAFIRSPAAPNGVSMYGYRITSGAESAREVAESRSLLLSPTLVGDPCFKAILQKIIGTEGTETNEMDDDDDYVLEKYGLFDIMKEKMKDVHVCSSVSFALVVFSLKRQNMAIKSPKSVEIIIQALREYKDHPQICLHLTSVIERNSIAFIENNVDSKALFGVILDILTGNKLDVDKTLENNDKLVRFVVNLLRNENERKHQKAVDPQREHAVKGLLAVLRKISKNEGGPYLIMYAGGVELLAAVLKKTVESAIPATGTREKSDAVENIISIVSTLSELSKNESICVSIVRGGALPPLFRTVEALSGDTDTLIQCCGIVKSCSQSCGNEVAEDFAKYDGIRIFADLLSNSFDSVDLAYSICSIFSDIVEYENIIQKALSCNFVEEIIRALDRHGISIQFCELVCAVLAKLTDPKSDEFAQSCEAIIRANGATSVLWALERHQKAFGMLVLVCNVLANITQDKDAAISVLDEDGIVLLADSFRAGRSKAKQDKRAHFTALKFMSQVTKNVISTECEDEKLLQDTSLVLNAGFEFAEAERLSFGPRAEDADVEAFKNSFLEAVLEAVKYMSVRGIPALRILDAEYHAFPILADVLDTPIESGDLERKRLVLGILSNCASAPSSEGTECITAHGLIPKIIKTVNSCSSDVLLCISGIDAIKKLYDRDFVVKGALLGERKHVIKVLEVVLQKNVKSTGTDVFTLFARAFELIEALISAVECKKRVNLERVLKVMVKVVLQVSNTRDFTSYGSEWEVAFYKMFLRIVRRVFGQSSLYASRSEKSGRNLLYRYSKVFRSYDGIDFLVKIMKKATKAKTGDIELFYLICDTFEHLSFDYENQQKIVNLNGISVIVNALSCYYEDTKFFIAACKVLQILALDETNIREIIDLHIVETITDVTKKTQLGNPEYCAASCSTLANITFKTETAIIASDCDAMDLAIQILRQYPHDHGVIRGASALIANLSLIEENISLIVGCGLVRTLTSLVDSLRKERMGGEDDGEGGYEGGDDDDDEEEGFQQADLLAMVISALTNITKFSEGKEEFVEKCNGIQLFTELFQDSLAQKEECAPIFDGVYSVFANIIFDERYIKKVVTDEFVSETVSLLNFYLTKGDDNEMFSIGVHNRASENSGNCDGSVNNEDEDECSSSSTASTDDEWDDDDDGSGDDGDGPDDATCNAFSSICAFLTNISIEVEYQVLIAWKNGIPPIVDSLGAFSDSPGVCDKACSLLRNLSLNGDNRREIADHGGIHRVLSVLEKHTASPEICTNACGVIANLLLDKDVATLAARENAVCAIAAAVRRNVGDPAVCERGCAALLLLLKSGCKFALLRAGVCVGTGLTVLKRLVDYGEDKEDEDDNGDYINLCETVCNLVATGVAAQRGYSLKSVFESNPWITEEFRRMIQGKSGGLLKWFKIW